jgi:hypothetical protein
LSFGERGDELVGPRPCVLEVQLAAASGEREPGGDVHQPMAQALRFSFRELTVTTDPANCSLSVRLMYARVQAPAEPTSRRLRGRPARRRAR